MTKSGRSQSVRSAHIKLKQSLMETKSGIERSSSLTILGNKAYLHDALLDIKRALSAHDDLDAAGDKKDQTYTDLLEERKIYIASSMKVIELFTSFRNNIDARFEEELLRKASEDRDWFLPD